VVGSLNDWRLQGYLFQDGTVFFSGAGAMKAFFIFQGRGNGVVLVAHLSRPLF
jgi:hypothetical protein